MAIDNKNVGKDVSQEDLETKFPLVAKKNKDHKTIVKAGGVEFGGKLIPVFAGPNAVENLEMILETAQAIKERGAHFLRAGAFKPLSFPYRSEKFFELREKGIEFLAKAKEKTGLPVITEIMHVEKVGLVAEVSDILQVGSRNMQNYPLLEAVAESKKPVMLKRHYGAPLRDWLGAAEYILHGGNPNVILCERGVSVPHTHRSSSRYLLDLQVVPAAQELTHLPVVTDPSHATFRREWVPAMSFASIGAGADAIMLEVHPDPENSAVDPLQPIGFEAFGKLMKDMERVARAVDRTLGVEL